MDGIVPLVKIQVKNINSSVKNMIKTLRGLGSHRLLTAVRDQLAETERWPPLANSSQLVSTPQSGLP